MGNLPNTLLTAMVRNTVLCLGDLCLVSLESLVTSFSLHTAKQIIKQVPDLGEQCDNLPGIGKEPGTERPETDYTLERQDLLQNIEDEFREWVMSYVVCYLEDK